MEPAMSPSNRDAEAKKPSGCDEVTPMKMYSPVQARRTES